MIDVSRDVHADLYKLFLIGLVAFGHLIEPALGLGAVRAVYGFVYLFHIPAFVFVAGMFTRPERAGARAGRLALVWAVFQVLYCLAAAVLGRPVPPLTQPYWILWFLCSLMFWTMMAPFWMRLPRAAALALAFGLALAAGFAEAIGYGLSLSRTFYFLPFFVAGLRLGPGAFALVRGRYAYGAAGLAVCAALWAFFFSALEPRVLYGSFSYAALGMGGIEGAGVRAGLLVLAFAALFSFAALMPVAGVNRGLTAMGARTMPVFLLHGLVVMVLQPAMQAVFDFSLAGGFISALVLTAGLVFVFSRPVFARVLSLTVRRV